MAAVLGVNRTLITAGGESQILSGQVDARVKCMVDTYVPLGTETAGSTIAMGGLIPTGARIIDVKIINAAQTASLTLSAGDSNSAARYTAAHAADTILVSTAIKAAGFNYVIGTNSGDNQILITTAGATLTITAPIKLYVLYTID